MTYFELSFTLQFVKIVFFITVVNISSQANQTNISPSEDKSGSQNVPTSGNFIIFLRVNISFLETFNYNRELVYFMCF